jgi:hypothetical protein
VNARHPWARIREDRAASPGRHSPDYLEKRPMPASPAAPLPLLSEREAARLGAPYPVPGEPKVQCKLCGTLSPVSEMSQIPELGWGPRCYDTDACTERQMDELYATRVPEVPALPAEPAPLPPSASPALEPLPKRVPVAVAEAVPVLPPAQEAALERFTEASDEQDAAEAGKDRGEDEEPPEAAEEPPVSDGDVQPGPYIDAIAAEHVQEYDPADEAAPAETPEADPAEGTETS